MTRKERIQTVLRKEIPDFTPYHFDMTMYVTDHLAEHYRLDRDAVEDHIGNHFLYVDYAGPAGEADGFRGVNENKTRYRDEFGVEWDVVSNYGIGDWGMVDCPVKNLDFSSYVFPDGRGGGRFEEAKRLMHVFPERFNVLRICGPFDLGWHLTGIEDFLVMMAANERLAFRVFEKLTEFIVNVIAAAPAGLDAVRIIEDWGLQKGLFFSKELWMKYIHPFYEDIHAAVRARGFHVMHHSCGDVAEIMPEIIDLGVEILDSMQPEAMDLPAIKREYGRDIVLFGGLGSQSTLPKGNVDTVLAEARETLRVLGEGGGYVLGPAGSVSTETPLENVLALVDFCRDLGA